MNDVRKPLVSLILLTYDRADFVEEALESVLAQTYPEIEIIVSDDGSTDPTMVQLLDRLEERRLLVLRNPHGVVPSSVHHGMAAARGVYAMILGDDDLIDPPYIAEAVDVMESDPQAGFVYCRATLFGSVNGPWDLPDFDIGGILLNNQIFATHLFRREDWRTTGGYDLSMVTGREDHDFVLKLLGIGRRPVRLEGTYFHYRQHERNSLNASAARTRETLVANHARIFRNNIDLYQDHAEEFWREIFGLIDEATDLRHRYASLERLRTGHPRLVGAAKRLLGLARGVADARPGRRRPR